MIKLIEEIDKDINRCVELMRENDYLEIVIGIEELSDKYKDVIKETSGKEKRVWNYSKKDLEKLTHDLLAYRNEINKKEYNIRLKEMLDSAIDFIKNDNTLDFTKKSNLLEKIKELQNINNEALSDDNLWNKLKVYLELSTNTNIEIGSRIIHIVNYILQNNKSTNK